MIAIAEHKSDYGVVTISESKRTGARTYSLNGVPQSEADSRGISTASYIHAIFGLIRQTTARRILMIGCGGGSLGTMLSLAGYRVAIVDVNPIAFAFARRHFGLPLNVDCHIGDGADYLAERSERYDAIVLDAYDGYFIPAQFGSQIFLARAYAATRERGFFFANVHALDDRDLAPDAFAAQLAPLWGSVRLLDEIGMPNRNTIVAAGPVQDLVPPALLFAPEVGASIVASELAAMAFRSPEVGQQGA